MTSPSDAPQTLKVRAGGATYPTAKDPHASYGEPREVAPVREVIDMDAKRRITKPLPADPYTGAP